MRRQIFYNLLWKLLERGGTQGIQLVVMLVLTRLLLPEDYGIMAVVIIFVSTATLLVDSGFYDALVQKENADDTDFSSVFYINILFALCLYSVLFITAPWVALFFEEPSMTGTLRVAGIALLFSACNIVQQVIIARAMQFKKLFMSSILAVVFSGAMGLFLAYAGYGVWALVAQQLISQCTMTVCLWLFVRWRPLLVYSHERIRALFFYSWKLVASTFIYNFYTHGQSFIIGKIFGQGMLGFYNRGMLLPNILVSNINGSIQAVMFPALAAQQRNPQRVKEMTRRAIVTSSFFLFPVMAGLAVIAEPLVSVLFTEKWLPMVPFLQLFCLYYALWTIDAANLHVIKALGHSTTFLKLEIVKCITGIVLVVVLLPFGIYAMAIGVVVNRIISTVIDAWPNSRYIQYHFTEQLKDVLPILLLTTLMGGCIASLRLFSLPDLMLLPLQIGVGTVVYWSLARLFRVECYMYVRLHVANLLKRRKDKAII